MKGDRYEPAEGVNSVQVGPIVISPSGYVAADDAEARELDACEWLVNKGHGKPKTADKGAGQ